MAESFLPPLVESQSPNLTLAQKIKLLYQLGHFPKDATIDELLQQIKDDQSLLLEEAVENWQLFHGRSPSGFLSASDQSLMVAPRCGLADIALASGDGVAQWGLKDITISANLSGMRNMTPERAMVAYSKAVETWNSVCGIRMKLVAYEGTGKTNIWARAMNIDGAGSTLAWSYLPGDDAQAGTRLEQRYELQENWSETYLTGVAIHEIGHALGLEHSNNKADIMYPYMRTNIMTVQPGDIARVVSRYGKPTTPVPPPTDPDGPSGGISVASVTVKLSNGTVQTLNAAAAPVLDYSPI